MPDPKRRVAIFLIPLVALLCLTPWISSALALLLGVALAVSVGNPYAEKTRKLTHILLTWSVMGLGAGMNLEVVAKVGLQGLGYTVVGIFTTLTLGFLITKVLGVEREIGILVSVGTAICGGSAIAAIAPTIRAKPHAISLSLGTVFMLNALALIVFPPIGHWFELTQTQFGLWSALAIHDTSSVVGASLQYGSEALQIGTTVKLARALWIVPLTVASSFFLAPAVTEGPSSKPKRPWFILGFLAAAALVTWIPSLQPMGHAIEGLAKRTLVLTLFLIGANLTLTTLKSVGVRPFVLGVLLWVIVASVTLSAIVVGWIH